MREAHQISVLKFDVGFDTLAAHIGEHNNKPKNVEYSLLIYPISNGNYPISQKLKMVNSIQWTPSLTTE